MIEVKNLVKKYGDHLAVDNLSFTVEKGQIYGFLGPNGAGKSTTMNIMTGYLGATEGQVLINGHDILKEPEEAKKCIGYLPEIPPLYMDMTVWEYLRFVAELKKIKKAEIEGAVYEVLELVGLEDVEKRLIKNLSKGYRQRVGLAQAIIGFPEIIILDEPMVGLDPLQIIEIRELIRKLAEDHTVILSSHILAEVQEMCDYIMIISKGKLVASDTPANLEKLMGTTEKIVVEVEGEREDVEGVLTALEEDTTWSIQPGEEGVWVVDIETKAGDIRKELAHAFASVGCLLLTLKKESVSLEDVFLQLTEKEPQSEDLEEENMDSDNEEDEYDDEWDDEMEEEGEVEDASDL